MVIKVTDYIKQCYSNSDGQIIRNLISTVFSDGQKVKVSFENVDSVTSSFVNTAFIALLDSFTYDFIRSCMSFSNSTKQINKMIKDRFEFEVSERKELVAR